MAIIVKVVKGLKMPLLMLTLQQCNPHRYGCMCPRAVGCVFLGSTDMILVAKKFVADFITYGYFCETQQAGSL